MNIIKKVSFLTLLLSVLISFNTFAMKYENYEYIPPMPSTETKHDDRSLEYRWTWISDEVCARFNVNENAKKATIERQYDAGVISRWGDNVNGIWQRKNRDTYSGKWSQSTEGIWSFKFDDSTIPLGVTKIDGVMYAFNTYGELKTGYEYYTGYKTEADGLVKADSAEFTQWLATQYVPDCISHE